MDSFIFSSVEDENCSDMKGIAQRLADLDDKKLTHLLMYLSSNLKGKALAAHRDGEQVELSRKLIAVSDGVQSAFFSMYEAWKMKQDKTKAQ